jgi:hypothetical protein
MKVMHRTGALRAFFDHGRQDGRMQSAPPGWIVLRGSDTVAVVRTIAGFRRDTMPLDSVMVFIAETRPVALRLVDVARADTTHRVGYLVLEPGSIRTTVYSAQSKP